MAGLSKLFLKHRSPGFLLIEGVIAAAVIAAFALMAVPQAMRMYREAVLEYEAVQLLHTIRYVQALSHSTASWPDGMVPQREEYVPSLRFSRTGYFIMRGRRQVIKSHSFPRGMTMISTMTMSRPVYFGKEGTVDLPFSLRLRMEGCARDRQIVMSLSGRCRLDRVG